MSKQQVIFLPAIGCTEAAAISRSEVCTLLARAHSNHAIIAVNGSLSPIDKQHQSPLTAMISRFAWVVVLAPSQGCGNEGWEEEKGRKRKGKG